MAHTFLLDPHVSFPSSTFPSGSKSSATFSLHAPLGFLTHVNYTCLRETWVRSLGWKMPWRRERLPAPVFWPGEFHGLYSPWGRKELDMTKRLSECFHTHMICVHYSRRAVTSPQCCVSLLVQLVRRQGISFHDTQTAVSRIWSSLL